MKVKKLQTKMAILGAVLALAGLQVMAQPVFLIVDEDFIDNDTNCSDVDFATGMDCVSIEECAFEECPGDNEPDVLVNDHNASIPGVAGGCQQILGINFVVDAGGMPAITLPTGEVGDEGLFAPAVGAFADLPGELSGYILCDSEQDEHYLDGLAGFPLGAAAIFALENKIVCAVLHDSDVSDLGDGSLNAMGARAGRTAFFVLDVLDHPKNDEYLPVMEVAFLGPTQVDSACSVDGECVLPTEGPCSTNADCCIGDCVNPGFTTLCSGSGADCTCEVDTLP